MVTFALEPRRPLVIAAKALVAVLLTAAPPSPCSRSRSAWPCTLLTAAIHDRGRFGCRTSAAFAVADLGVTCTRILLVGGFRVARHHPDRRCSAASRSPRCSSNTPAAIVAFFVYKWVLPRAVRPGRRADGLVRRPARGSTSRLRRARSGTGRVTARSWAQLVVVRDPLAGRLPLAIGHLAGAARRGQVGAPLGSAA